MRGKPPRAPARAQQIQVGKEYLFNNATAIVLVVGELEIVWEQSLDRIMRKTPRWYFEKHARVMDEKDR